MVNALSYIFAVDSIGLSSFKFLWWALTDAALCNRVRIGRSRSSKVDFDTNRKGVCDFLLVINSNLSLIVTLILSCTVSEIWRLTG